MSRKRVFYSVAMATAGLLLIAVCVVFGSDSYSKKTKSIEKHARIGNDVDSLIEFLDQNKIVYSFNKFKPNIYFKVEKRGFFFIESACYVVEASGGKIKKVTRSIGYTGP